MEDQDGPHVKTSGLRTQLIIHVVLDNTTAQAPYHDASTQLRPYPELLHITEGLGDLAMYSGHPRNGKGALGST